MNASNGKIIKKDILARLNEVTVILQDYQYFRKNLSQGEYQQLIDELQRIYLIMDKAHIEWH